MWKICIYYGECEGVISQYCQLCEEQEYAASHLTKNFIKKSDKFIAFLLCILVCICILITKYAN